ncbi:MAG: DivIVA domain-containing protein [Chloroflexi bacterium]|nr:DivIVA domain-containing protein [Chloroflexota bacterium]
MAEEGFERITPVDIHNRKFSLAFRGYNEDEVDSFLDVMEKNFELLYLENKEIREKMALKDHEINLLRQSVREGAVIPINSETAPPEPAGHEPSTLEGIGKTTRSIIENAKCEADEIINRAKYEAEVMKTRWAEKLKEVDMKRIDSMAQESQTSELSRIKNEVAALERTKERFYLQFENLLRSQLDWLESSRKIIGKDTLIDKEAPAGFDESPLDEIEAKAYIGYEEEEIITPGKDEPVEWPPPRYSELNLEELDEAPRLRAVKDEEE